MRFNAYQTIPSDNNHSAKNQRPFKTSPYHKSKCFLWTFKPKKWSFRMTTRHDSSLPLRCKYIDRFLIEDQEHIRCTFIWQFHSHMETLLKSSKKIEKMIFWKRISMTDPNKNSRWSFLHYCSNLKDWFFLFIDDFLFNIQLIKITFIHQWSTKTFFKPNR